MLFSWMLSILAYTVAALVLKTEAAPQHPELESPCPNFFQYDSLKESGRWTGNLVLNSEDDLHGLWIRLIFDSPVKEVTAEGFEVTQPSEEGDQILIKNKDLLLKDGSTKHVKISVKYDGDVFPKLIQYRLNAKVVCPDSSKLRKDFFEGDIKSKDFFSSILSNVNPNILQSPFKCSAYESETYPWQASVSIRKSDNVETICDGALISASHVLLPAHCITFRGDTQKIPSDIISVTLVGNQEKIGVSKIIVHPGYNPDTLSEDLAVLELSSVTKISDKVAPICVNDKTVEGNAFLVGTGLNEENVKKAPILVSDVRDCTTRNPGWDGLLHDNTLCGSYSHRNEAGCVAKSGSTIFSFNEDRTTLIGLVTLLPEIQNQSCKGSNLETEFIAVDITRYYRWILHSIA